MLLSAVCSESSNSCFCSFVTVLDSVSALALLLNPHTSCKILKMVQFERIVLIVHDIDVQLELPDGSTVDVPQDVARSKLLTQAISTENSGTVSLNAPKGFLASWLQCISALKGSAKQPGRLCAPFSPELSAYDPQLPAFLTVRHPAVCVCLCNMSSVGSMRCSDPVKSHVMSGFSAFPWDTSNREKVCHKLKVIIYWGGQLL